MTNKNKEGAIVEAMKFLIENPFREGTSSYNMFEEGRRQARDRLQREVIDVMPDGLDEALSLDYIRDGDFISIDEANKAWKSAQEFKKKHGHSYYLVFEKAAKILADATRGK